MCLPEITDRYQRADTRRILEGIQNRGVTPARPAFGCEDYDPRSELGWGSRLSAASDYGGETNWAWWREACGAGPRPLYWMPDPYERAVCAPAQAAAVSPRRRRRGPMSGRMEIEGAREPLGPWDLPFVNGVDPAWAT
ncbi:hypothetical protein ACIGBH_38995 [Streptomyces sp. NPDC085929]|uniref:hypothetical protein n=1 Tax=Streptomyces sp. NPDC085929 TaxID=3365739 RepID=UPI0037D96D7F